MKYVTVLSVQCFSEAAGSTWYNNLKLLVLFRQIVARGLLDVLREFSDNENDFISVMETVARMSEDGGAYIFLFITACGANFTLYHQHKFFYKFNCIY